MSIESGRVWRVDVTGTGSAPFTSTGYVIYRSDIVPDSAFLTANFGGATGNDTNLVLLRDTPVLTLPEINDDTGEFQYVWRVADLAADVNIFLPLLTASDTFVFENHPQTLTNKTFGDNLDMSGNKIINVATPTAGGDAVNKSYVDAQIKSSDYKESVKLATTVDLDSNASISGGATYTPAGGASGRGQLTAVLSVSDTFTVDGVSLGAADDGSRILLKDQSDGSENGIWTTTISGTSLTLDRAEDYDEDVEVSAGNVMFVEEGSTNANQGYQLTTNDPIVIGGGTGTVLAFSQFTGGGGLSAGDGIDIGSNIVSADLKVNGGLVIESTEIAVDLSATSITGTLAVGDGGTGATTLTDNAVLLGNGTGAVQATSSVGQAVLTTTSGNVPELVAPGDGIAISGTTGVMSVDLVANGGLEFATGELGIDIKANGGIVLESGEVAVDLGATSITGTLVVGDGGTGATTLTDNAVLIGNGTGVVQATSSVANALLTTDSSSVPELRVPGDGIDVSAAGTIAVDLASSGGLEFDTGELKVQVKPFGGIDITATGLAVDMTASGIVGTLDVPQGGTGAATHTDNAILIGNGADPIQSTSSVTQALLSTNSAGVPELVMPGNGIEVQGSGNVQLDLKANGGAVFESGELAVDLGATSITGTLAVGDGGTGATTLTDNAVLLGNGTSAVQATSSVANALLTTDSSSVPELRVPGDGIDVSAAGTIAVDLASSGGLEFDTGELKVQVKPFGGVEITATGLEVNIDASGITGTWQVPQGGTGAGTFTDNGILIGNGTDPVQATSSGNQKILSTTSAGIPDLRAPGNGIEVQGSGNVQLDLKSNGGAVFESGELAVDLGASSITGTLAVGDGGTGATTLTDNSVLLGNGTGVVQSTSSVASALLTTNSSSVPELRLPGDGVELTAAGILQLDLKANGGAVIESNELAVDLGATSITGTLVVGDGGTGVTTLASDGVLYGNGTGVVQVTNSQAGSLLVTQEGMTTPEFRNTSIPGFTMVMGTSGELNMNGNKITNVGSPTLDDDAVNKLYVDSLASGLDPKESVACATIADIGGTYASGGGSGGTGEFTGVDLGDAAAWDISTSGDILLGMRLLVKNQTDLKENGIYVVTTSGDAGVIERSSDQDGSPANEVSAGNYTFVESGPALANTGWVTGGSGILTLNTDDIPWIQFNGAANILAGTGLTKSGNTINAIGSSTIIANANDLEVNSSSTAGQTLISGGVSGTAATFGALDLANANARTGTLPVGNGGTGRSTLTDQSLMVGNGTGIVDLLGPTLSTIVGFDGSSNARVFAMNNGLVLAAGNLSLDLGPSGALEFVGGQLEVQVVANGGVIKAAGGLEVDLGATGITGVVQVPQGGTGLSSITTNALVYGAGTADLNVLAPNGGNGILVSATGGAPSWQNGGAGQILLGQGAGVPVFTNPGTGLEVVNNVLRVDLIGSGGIVLDGNSLKLNLSNTSTGIVGNLPVNRGGTGRSSIGTNELIYGNNSTSVSTVSAAANSVLISTAGNVPAWITASANYQLLVGGTAAAPTFNGLGTGLEFNGTKLEVDILANGGIVLSNNSLRVDLGASNLTGTVPVSQGGTGVTTLADQGILYGNGTGVVEVTSSVNQALLTTTSTGLPGLRTPGDGIEMTTAGVIQLDLKANGGAIIESNELAIDLGATSITGTLAVGDGGTGATTITTDALVIGQGTSAVAEITPTSGSVLITPGGDETPSWLAMPTKGDMLVSDGSGPVVLSAGTSGQLLIVADNETEGVKYVKNTMNYSYNSDNGTNSTEYTTLGSMVYPGSSVFPLHTVNVISRRAAGSSNTYSLRLFDVTNVAVIAEVTGKSNDNSTIDSLGAVSNVPSGQALLEFQLKVTGSAPYLDAFVLGGSLD